MIHFEVYVLPLIVVAIVNFFLSWLYYSPAAPWFRAWARGVGRDPDAMNMTDAERKQMPFMMGGALVASFLLSYVLQVVVHSAGVAGFWPGVLVGVVCWLGFAVTHSLNTLFEGRKLSVLTINNGLYLLTYAVFAGVIAVWR
ncbi:MAG TPA: DUF1761 domain-containing protein [Rectinemataceae bacterium]|nr:DUF1761 domain-containing protein [Rectinemataceae bacterium]